MWWAGFAILIGLVVGIVALILIGAGRRSAGRFFRPSDTESPGVSGSAEAIYGLDPGELSQFQRVAREYSREHRERWDRDYPTDSSKDMPGHVPGLPRGLRVKR
jgi:hypothetical protein